MTNEKLKKKIVEILEETEYEWTEQKNGYILQIFYDKLADAIIAAGIGDVSEYKHRAERAEKALEKFAENITCEDCPYFSDCASSEKMEDLIHSNYCFAEYLRQAEKELAEERKDE